MSKWKMSDEVSEKKTLPPSELNAEDQIQSYEQQQEYSRSLNRFPDEIILQIFNKLFDLKSLCRCSLVSKRFSSLILQIHSVSFTVPRLIHPQINPNPNPNPNENFPQKLSRFFTTAVVAKPFQFLRRFVSPKPLPAVLSSFYGDSFRSSVQFLNRFEGIRSLRIQLPSSFHGNTHDSLVKWAAKFGSRIESFVFVSPNSILEMERLTDDESEEEVDSGLTTEFLKQRVHMAFQCLKDVIVRHRFILFFIEEHPLLHSIEISDSEEQGRLCLGPVEVAEVRNSIGAKKVNLKVERLEVPISVYQSFVPVLELPVSGFAMKGVTLVLMEMVERNNGDDGLDVVGNGFGDGKCVYDEAVMEIMTKHRSKMKKLL